MTVLFYVAAAVAVAAAVLVVTRRNAVHALLYLVVSFLAVAVVLFLLGAPFVAALEVIIYAGAIMVFFVFVVMMVEARTAPAPATGLRLRTWAGPVVLTLVLLGEFVYIMAFRGPHPFRAAEIPPAEVGASLFGTYLLGVELAAMLLLGAVAGAFRLGRQRLKPIHRFFADKEEPAP